MNTNFYKYCLVAKYMAENYYSPTDFFVDEDGNTVRNYNCLNSQVIYVNPQGNASCNLSDVIGSDLEKDLNF